MKLDPELFDRILQLQQKNFDNSDVPASQDEINDLMKSYVLVENANDDLLTYRAIAWNRRKTQGVYNITIAPTMDCNFKCYYCFEDSSKTYMSEDICKRIAKFINESKDLKQLNLTWFGGEPLLAFEQICRITESIYLSNEQHSHTTIITNGYYLTKAVVDKLDALRINRLQITVDGLFEKYNIVKFSKEDRHCFDVLLNNIDYSSFAC